MFRRLIGPLLGATLAAAAPAPKPGLQFDGSPFSSAIAFAQVQHIPLDHPRVPDPPISSAAGDRIVYVAALVDPDAVREWLIDLQRVPPNEAEAHRPAVKTVPLYSALGNSFVLESARAVEQVRIAGPFLDAAFTRAPAAARSESFSDHTARFVIAQGYLEFGLDHAAAYLARLGARLPSDPQATLPLEWNNRPFPAAAVAAARSAAARSGVTAEEDRIGCEILPALLEFFRIAEKTPGLQLLLRRVLAVPSYWSLATHGGVSDIGFVLDPRHTRRLQDRGAFISAPIYALPFALNLNGQPSLGGEFSVTAPRAPLAVGAGVIGLVAGPPPGKKGSIFLLRLVGAQPGG
jgi:hypothetical protein